MDKKNELLVRVYFVMFMFILVAVLILGRVVKITLFEGDKWRGKADAYVKWMEKKVDRGDIYDANGNLLATSLPFFDVRMDLLISSDAVFENNIDSLAICLAKLWPNGKPASKWKAEFIQGRYAGKNKTKKGMSYFQIADGVNLDEMEKLKKFPIFREGHYGGGLILERTTKREKPFREIASRTIGTDRANAQNVGLEDSFDKFLRGKTTKQLMKRIKKNLWVPVQNPAEFDAKKGDDIITTLDINIQDIVHTELLKAVTKEQAKAGTAILMEVETGAIKAITNLERSKSKESYYEEYNYGIGQMTEPGSTLKLATMMALMEDSCVALNDKVRVYGGKKKFYGEWMYDSEMHGKDEMTVMDVFKFSSNVGIASLADQCFNKDWSSRQKFTNYFRQFGLDQKTGIEINGEVNPYIKDAKEHRKSFWLTSVPWMAHGYEMHLSPLQVLNFYNTVANEGKKMKPYLVESILREGKTLHQFHPKVVDESIARKETIEKAQELLHSVVKSGTGRRLKSKEFSFAGKTGTTRVDYDKDAEGVKKKYNASFAGYFPAEDPKYSLIVVIYDPSVSYYGSSVAGPVFRNIAEKCNSLYFKNQLKEQMAEMKDFMIAKKQSGYGEDYDQLMAYMDVDYQRSSKAKWVNLLPSEDEVKMDKKRILKNKIPDVRGMGIRDATYVLESLGLKVKTEGLGKVVTQTIKPGTKNVGQEIELLLN